MSKDTEKTINWTENQQKKLANLKREINKAYKRASKNPDENVKWMLGRTFKSKLDRSLENLEDCINDVYFLEHGFPETENEPKQEPEPMCDKPIFDELPVDEGGFTDAEII